MKQNGLGLSIFSTILYGALTGAIIWAYTEVIRNPSHVSETRIGIALAILSVALFITLRGVIRQLIHLMK